MSNTRLIRLIANEIVNDWPNPGPAKQYLDFMQIMNFPSDKFGDQTGFDIMEDFLSYAGRWQGHKARKIKEEIKKILVDYYVKMN